MLDSLDIVLPLDRLDLFADEDRSVVLIPKTETVGLDKCEDTEVKCELEAATEWVSSSNMRSSCDTLLDILEDNPGREVDPPATDGATVPAVDPAVVAVAVCRPAPTCRTRFCKIAMPGLFIIVHPHNISICLHL